MNIEVHLFARARDLAGSARLTVDLPERATVAVLRSRLTELLPSLRALLARSMIAVDNEVAEDGKLLRPDSEVALLPPVSGG